METPGGVSILGSSLRSVYTLGWGVYAGAYWIWGIPVSSIDWPLLVWGLTGFIAFLLTALSVQMTKPGTETSSALPPTTQPITL